MIRKPYQLAITAIVALAAFTSAGILTSGFIAPANELEVQATVKAPQPDFGTGGTPIAPDDSLHDSQPSQASSSAGSSALESSAAVPGGEDTPSSALPPSSENGESSSQQSFPALPPPSVDGSYSTSEPVSPSEPDPPSKPKPPSKPESSSKPEPSSKPESSSKPEPSSKPESSSKPEPSSEPESSAPSSGETLRVSINGTVTEGDAYDLLCQIVEAEMGGTFHAEALKAQAVAAYSYIKYENAAGRTPSLPGRTPSQKTQDAVSAVLGEALYYGGSVAFTPYHASSAGYTNPSSEVWGGSYPYLVRVDSPYDPSAAYRNVQVAMQPETLRPKLETYLGITLPDDPEGWFGEISANAGGYVTTVTVYDADGGSHTLTGRQMRETVLAYGIRSHAFSIEVSGGQIVFTTNGYGHGVGMSQTGANAYAVNDGWTYAQILSHYYPGTSLS